MINIVLFEPEIPPNTGNIIRLTANTGFHLHLIEPLGFSLDEKSVRRAGMDYNLIANISIHKNWQAYLDHEGQPSTKSIYALSTKGQRCYSKVKYQPGDTLVFGPETRGLSQDFRDALLNENIITVPMKDGNRSLNLSNTVAIVCYEAWRQHDYS